MQFNQENRVSKVVSDPGGVGRSHLHISSRAVGPYEALTRNLARPFRPRGLAGCDDRVAPGLFGKRG